MTLICWWPVKIKACFSPIACVFAQALLLIISIPVTLCHAIRVNRALVRVNIINIPDDVCVCCGYHCHHVFASIHLSSMCDGENNTQWLVTFTVTSFPFPNYIFVMSEMGTTHLNTISIFFIYINMCINIETFKSRFFFCLCVRFVVRKEICLICVMSWTSVLWCHENSYIYFLKMFHTRPHQGGMMDGMGFTQSDI